MNQTRVIPGISDHEAVFVESSLRPIKKPTCPRRIFKYQKADFVGFRQDLKELMPSFLKKANTLDLNTLWIEFKSIIHRLMENTSPLRHSREKRKKRKKEKSVLGNSTDSGFILKPCGKTPVELHHSKKMGRCMRIHWTK